MAKYGHPPKTPQSAWVLEFRSVVESHSIYYYSLSLTNSLPANFHTPSILPVVLNTQQLPAAP